MNGEPITDVHAPDARGRMFWVGLVGGFAIMGYGIVGLVSDSGATQPLKFATWLVGADVLHDLVVAPIVGLVGAGLLARVTRGWRVPVRAGVVASAFVLVIGWIPLRGYGRLADNPSLAPLDYATAILTALAIVWGVCALWLGWNAWRGRTRAPGSGATEPAVGAPR